MGSLVRSPSKIAQPVGTAAGPLRDLLAIRLTFLPARFCRAGAGWQKNRANQSYFWVFNPSMAFSFALIVLKIGIVRPILAIFIAQYLP
jgi:hypothetical protein